MNIQLQQIHIQNLRSIREATVRLWPFSVLFGKNDSGKSNLLLALSLAFGNGNINAQDVFSSSETPYDSKSSVIIDTKFIPIDDEGKQASVFNDLWGLHLGVNAMVDDDDNQFFAFRTEFTYDADKEEYVRDRVIINEWRGSEIVVGGPLRYKTLTAFEFIYLDAQRDMSSDIRDKNSMWSKQISKLKLSPCAKAEIEASLGDLSDRIMEESPFLRQVSEDLTSATNTKNTSVSIDPVTRSVDELYKGLDIFISQNDSSLIPISNLGLGTRSRAVFASLKTIVNKKIDDAKETPYFCMIAFEEPESHIHPHSQRELVKDFSSIKGQRIVTTHSPYILSSSKVSDLIYVAMRRAESHFSLLANLDLAPEELRHIDRFVLNTRGELLFSDITVLSEGETEEQSLPIFFKEYFGYEPFELGVSFVGVGGKNYLPFLRMLECIGTSWYIFSDGETAAKNDLQSIMKQLRGLTDKPDLSQFRNIIILDNSNNFETYLLDSGYSDEIITAINEYEGVEYEEYKMPYFDYYVNRYNEKPMKPRSTGEKCEKCGQTIMKQHPRDYHSEGGRDRALRDCMKDGKTKYAVPISRTILSTCTGERKYPPKIKLLLEQIGNSLEV